MHIRVCRTGKKWFSVTILVLHELIYLYLFVHLADRKMQTAIYESCLVLMSKGFCFTLNSSSTSTKAASTAVQEGHHPSGGPATQGQGAPGRHSAPLHGDQHYQGERQTQHAASCLVFTVVCCVVGEPTLLQMMIMM